MLRASFHGAFRFYSTNLERPFLKKSFDLNCKLNQNEFKMRFVPLRQSEQGINVVISELHDYKPTRVFVTCGPSIMMKSFHQIIPIESAASSQITEYVYFPLLEACKEAQIPTFSIGVDDKRIFDYHVTKGFQEKSIMPTDLGSGRIDKWSEEEEIDVMKQHAPGLYQTLIYERTLFSFYNMLSILRSIYGLSPDTGKKFSRDTTRRMTSVTKMALAFKNADPKVNLSEEKVHNEFIENRFLVVSSARLHEAMCEMAEQGLPSGEFVPIDSVLLSNIDRPLSLLQRISQRMIFIFPLGLLLGSFGFCAGNILREWLKDDATKQREAAERRRQSILERNKLRDKVSSMNQNRG